MMEENSSIHNQFDFIENIPTPVVAINLESGTMIHGNQPVENLLGYKISELKGKSVQEVYSNKSEINQVLKTGLTTRRVRDKKMTLKSKNGNEIPVLFNMKIIERKSIVYGIVTWDKINKELHLRKSQQQSQYQFNELFNHANFAISITTLEEGKIIKTNQKFDELFRITADNRKEFRTRMIYANPSERKELLNQFNETGKIEDYQLQMQDLEGRQFWSILTSSILPYEGERVVLTIVNKVEKMKRLENALKESNRDLENFAYIASHDLQQPLRTIKGFTELLEKDFHDVLGEKGRKFIDYINNGIYTLQDLIDGLLRYSKIGSNELILTTFSPKEVIEEVKQRLYTLVEETNTVISVFIDDVDQIQGDRDMISLALQNLISNAIKYHGDKPPKIQIQFTYQDKNTVIVTVQDNGIGIEESSQNSIFDMFSRLHSKSKIPGSGLGLAIVRRVVKRHHGQTGVESRVGEGSTFWFTLPQYEYTTE